MLLPIFALLALINSVISGDGQVRTGIENKGGEALVVNKDAVPNYTVKPAFPGDAPHVTGFRFNEFGPGQFGVEQRNRKKYNYDIHQLANGQYQLKKHRSSYSAGIVGNILQGALRAVLGLVPFQADKKFPGARKPNGDFADPRAAFPFYSGPDRDAAPSQPPVIKPL